MAELYGKIVLPGEEIEKNNYTYKFNDKTISKKVLLVSQDEKRSKVVPLSEVYYPSVGDKIIGIVREVEASGWFVDINSVNYAFLPLAEAVKEFIDVYRTDLSKILDVDAVIHAKVINVVKNKIVQISIKDEKPNKLIGGGIIKVNPAKVARIIGKNMSMVKLISEKTNSKILIGKNGYVWINAKDADSIIKAINAIKFVERNAHLKGLTELVSNYLEKL